MRSYRLLPLALLLLTLSAAAGSTSAADADGTRVSAPGPALGAADLALLQRGVDYLQGLTAVTGRFTQTDPKGKVSRGLFYMQRPGRARFQYDPPSELLVVSDGDMVSVYDRKLKSFDQYPLDQTPLAILLGKTIRLDRGVQVTGVDKTADGFVIQAKDASPNSHARLAIAFSEHPLTLKGWTIVDAQDQKTVVRLGPLTRASSFNPNLFVLGQPKLDDPRQ